MFIDYYALLEINELSTQEEIKAAFRKQAIKWHPDRNLGRDTNPQMQRINEGYLILKDSEAKRKFDIEYQRFKAFKNEQRNNDNKFKEQTRSTKEEKANTDFGERHESKNEYEDYSFNDETLKNWMSNARRQSVDLAKQTIQDFKGMVEVGLKEGVKASANAFIGQIIFSIIVIVIIALYKSCKS